MGLNNLAGGIVFVKDLLGRSSEKLKSLSSNPKVIGIVAGAGTLGVGAVVGATISKIRKKRASSRTTRKRSSRTKTKRKTKKRTYKYARTAGKGKDRSTKRIRMTKNGQPYIILKSGKARFISKRSARLSRKRKGGRY